MRNMVRYAGDKQEQLPSTNVRDPASYIRMARDLHLSLLALIESCLWNCRAQHECTHTARPRRPLDSNTRPETPAIE